ncbi:JAB domain-containing protein [Rossellomorea marisflavi]|uniref:JAB domain-containing protein n=1 Tax=Rossellomorea marisflavi TaxID=189381 RepID=UPI0009E5E635|nr:JAB domain-containing protein [Rossellomorea marisflavi]
MSKVYEVVKIKQVIKEVAEEEKFIIHCPQDGANVAAEFIGDEDREVFFILCMNTKNHVVAVHRCHVGGLNASLVVPREVFKSAILNNSASIILSHQHPSQDVTPSREDIEVTHRLVECGRLLGIEVLDHLIVNAKADFYSMKEKGYL